MAYSPLELNGGKEAGGRFGTSMTPAGDLNRDGYYDVVVSAPFAENGKGVVYIYHGSPQGIVLTPQQVMSFQSVNINHKSRNFKL